MENYELIFELWLMFINMNIVKIASINYIYF